MNRLLLALAVWALAGCQTAAPVSPAPTAHSTASPPPTAAPSPSGAAKLIAFARGTENGAQLIVVEETGGVARPISSPDLEVPRWSPDGEWIAAARAESDQSVHVSLVRADGSGPDHLWRGRRMLEAIPRLVFGTSSRADTFGTRPSRTSYGNS